MLTPGDETRVSIEANFGLLESEGGAPFTWTCHETIVSFSGVVPAYATNADGVLLGSARLIGFGVDPMETLYRSADDGCTWTPVSDMTGVSAVAIAFDPANPARAFAAASNGGTGTINALWVSNDAGASWTKTPIEVPHYVNGVRFSVSDPLVVWATSSDLPNDAAFVYWSSNGGVSFATHPWLDQPSGTALGSLAVVATSHTDPLTAWVRTYGVPHRVWLTTNGGLAFEEVLGTTQIVDVEALPDGRVWVATATSGFFVSLDGRTFTNAVAGESPRPRGFAHDGRGLLTVTDPFLDPFALTLSTSGDPRIGATGLFRVEELAGPKPCAAGTTVANVCPQLWPAMQVRLGIAPGRVPTPVGRNFEDRSIGVGGGGGCSCSAAGPSPSLPALAIAAGVVALLVRRRR